MLAAKIHRFLRLERARRDCLVRAVLLLTYARIGLALMRYKTTSAGLAWLRQDSASYSQNDALWAMALAVKAVPGAKCLAQVMTYQTLMHPLGIATEIIVGVKPQGAHLAAHAWLVNRHGAIVWGGDDASLAGYRVITRAAADGVLRGVQSGAMIK